MNGELEWRRHSSDTPLSQDTSVILDQGHFHNPFWSDVVVLGFSIDSYVLINIGKF